MYAQETIYKNTLIYSQKQGLSSPNIHKIVQDKYGFIWVATQDGLNRFEGSQFIKYNYGQRPNRQLFSPDIRDLVLDNKAGLLWVICNQGGINAIDLATGSTIASYPYLKNKLHDEWRICATFFNNRIYIGTSGGLDIFDISKGSFINDLPVIVKDKNCQDAFFSDIRSININNKGIMALGLLDKGIFIFDLHKLSGFLIERNRAAEQDPGRFWPLCGQFINDDIFYCGTQNGLYTVDCRHLVINSESKKPALDPLALGTGSVAAMVQSENGDILFAGDELTGLNTGNNTKYLVIPTFYEARSWLKNATSLFQDNKKNIWIGSRQGLCLVKNDEPAFKAVKNNNILYGNKLGHIFSVCAINDTSVLAGTKDGLFIIGQNFTLKQVYDKGLVQNILRITKGEFLISGYNGASLFINGKIEKLSARFPALLPYEDWQFNSYVRVNDSISLLGTESNQGVLEWNTYTSKINRLYAGAGEGKQLPSDIVNSIFINRKGQPAILSDYFISVYDPVQKTVKAFSINKNSVQGIYMDMLEAAGDYWIAAYGTGLLRTDQQFNVKKIYRAEDGLSNSGLYSIFNYKDSILFLTTNFGISTFNIKTKKFSNYYEEDGLQNNTFEEACRDTMNGIFFAGGTDGYVKIVPENLQSNTRAPLLYYTRILAEGASANLLDTTNLNAASFIISENSIQTKIFFSGLHYENSGRVIYSYKIKELADHWINLGPQNFVSLIGLSPGTYHLQVRAANEDGIWSDPRELVLEFLPKWYQTWWFKLLIFLAIAGIMYAFYRYRIAQIKKQHEIRKNIATDLHDDLGSTLNSVKVFTNLAISGVKQEESLQQVKDNLNEATMGLRDMIWVLDDSLDTVDELVTRLKQYAIPVAAASNIQAEIKADSEINNRQLSKEEKRNLFLVCKEVINNSIKYAEASKINIAITASGKKIQIVIRDNGKGFNVDEVKKGYGLKNMQYRTGQIKYKASLVSSPGKGTQITIQPS